MAANNDHIVWAAVLPEVEIIEANARNAREQLANSHGCEAGSQRSYESGKLDALADLRKALGLPLP